MKLTFREKVLNIYKKVVRKRRYLKYPAMGVAWIVLMLDGFRLHLIGNYKRYFSIAFALLFFTFSCSFTGAVFNTDSVYFMNEEQKIPMTVDSDAELAAQVEVEPIIIEDDDVLDGYEDNLNMEEVAKYSVEDLDDIGYLSLDDFDALSDNEDPSDAAEEIFEFDQNDWRLILINKQHPIPADFELHLGTIKGSMQCDERIIPDLVNMLQAAKTDGVELVICSPYRDLSRQEMLFGRKVNKYMAQGMSYMDAYKTSSQAVTVPGASEHQIGLALDIISSTYSNLDEGFGETKAGQWLSEHSCEYGFILRYPLGKEYITSIEFEPWHFRYVGKEAATLITNEQITLEEFWDRTFN